MNQHRSAYGLASSYDFDKMFDQAMQGYDVDLETSVDPLTSGPEEQAPVTPMAPPQTSVPEQQQLVEPVDHVPFVGPEETDPQYIRGMEKKGILESTPVKAVTGILSLGNSIPVGLYETAKSGWDWDKLSTALKDARTFGTLMQESGKGNMWLGMAADILLDPLTYFSFGTWGLTKVAGKGNVIVKSALKSAKGSRLMVGRKALAMFPGVTALDDGTFLYSLSLRGQKKFNTLLKNGISKRDAESYLGHLIDNTDEGLSLLHTGGWRIGLPDPTKMFSKVDEAGNRVGKGILEGWRFGGHGFPIGVDLKKWLTEFSGTRVLDSTMGLFSGLDPDEGFRFTDRLTEKVGLETGMLRRARTAEQMKDFVTKELKFNYGLGLVQSPEVMLSQLINRISPMTYRINSAMLSKIPLDTSGQKLTEATSEGKRLGQEKERKLWEFWLKDFAFKDATGKEVLDEIVGSFDYTKAEYLAEGNVLDQGFLDALNTEAERVHRMEKQIAGNAPDSHAVRSLEQVKEELSTHILAHSEIVWDDKSADTLRIKDKDLSYQLRRIQEQLLAAGEDIKKNTVHQKIWAERMDLEAGIEANDQVAALRNTDSDHDVLQEAYLESINARDKILEEYNEVIEKVRVLEGEYGGQRLESAVFQRQLDDVIGEQNELLADPMAADPTELDQVLTGSRVEPELTASYDTELEYWDEGVEQRRSGSLSPTSNFDEQVGELASIEDKIKEALRGEAIARMRDQARIKYSIDRPLFDGQTQLIPQMLTPKVIRQLDDSIPSDLLVSTNKIISDYFGPITIREANAAARNGSLKKLVVSKYLDNIKSTMDDLMGRMGATEPSNIFSANEFADVNDSVISGGLKRIEQALRTRNNIVVGKSATTDQMSPINNLMANQDSRDRVNMILDAISDPASRARLEATMEVGDISPSEAFSGLITGLDQVDGQFTDSGKFAHQTFFSENPEDIIPLSSRNIIQSRTWDGMTKEIASKLGRTKTEMQADGSMPTPNGDNIVTHFDDGDYGSVDYSPASDVEPAHFGYDVEDDGPVRAEAEPIEPEFTAADASQPEPDIQINLNNIKAEQFGKGSISEYSIKSDDGKITRVRALDLNGNYGSVTGLTASDVNPDLMQITDSSGGSESLFDTFLDDELGYDNFFLSAGEHGVEGHVGAGIDRTNPIFKSYIDNIVFHGEPPGNIRYHDLDQMNNRPIGQDVVSPISGHSVTSKRAAAERELLKVEGVGPQTANSILEGFDNVELEGGYKGFSDLAMQRYGVDTSSSSVSDWPLDLRKIYHHKDKLPLYQNSFSREVSGNRMAARDFNQTIINTADYQKQKTEFIRRNKDKAFNGYLLYRNLPDNHPFKLSLKWIGFGRDKSHPKAFKLDREDFHFVIHSLWRAWHSSKNALRQSWLTDPHNWQAFGLVSGPEDMERLHRSYTKLWLTYYQQNPLGYEKLRLYSLGNKSGKASLRLNTSRISTNGMLGNNPLEYKIDDSGNLTATRDAEEIANRTYIIGREESGKHIHMTESDIKPEAFLPQYMVRTILDLTDPVSPQKNLPVLMERARQGAMQLASGSSGSGPGWEATIARIVGYGDQIRSLQFKDYPAGTQERVAESILSNAIKETYEGVFGPMEKVTTGDYQLTPKGYPVARERGSMSGLSIDHLNRLVDNQGNTVTPSVAFGRVMETNPDFKEIFRKKAEAIQNNTQTIDRVSATQTASIILPDNVGDVRAHELVAGKTDTGKETRLAEMAQNVQGMPIQNRDVKPLSIRSIVTNAESQIGGAVFDAVKDSQVGAEGRRSYRLRTMTLGEDLFADGVVNSSDLNHAVEEGWLSNWTQDTYEYRKVSLDQPDMELGRRELLIDEDGNIMDTGIEDSDSFSDAKDIDEFDSKTQWSIRKRAQATAIYDNSDAVIVFRDGSVDGEYRAGGFGKEDGYKSNILGIPHMISRKSKPMLVVDIQDLVNLQKGEAGDLVRSEKEFAIFRSHKAKGELDNLALNISKWLASTNNTVLDTGTGGIGSLGIIDDTAIGRTVRSGVDTYTPASKVMQTLFSYKDDAGSQVFRSRIRSSRNMIGDADNNLVIRSTGKGDSPMVSATVRNNNQQGSFNPDRKYLPKGELKLNVGRVTADNKPNHLVINLGADTSIEAVFKARIMGWEADDSLKGIANRGLVFENGLVSLRGSKGDGRLKTEALAREGQPAGSFVPKTGSGDVVVERKGIAGSFKETARDVVPQRRNIAFEQLSSDPLSLSEVKAAYNELYRIYFDGRGQREIKLYRDAILNMGENVGNIVDEFIPYTYHLDTHISNPNERIVPNPYRGVSPGTAIADYLTRDLRYTKGIEGRVEAIDPSHQLMVNLDQRMKRVEQIRDAIGGTRNSQMDQWLQAKQNINQARIRYTEQGNQEQLAKLARQEIHLEQARPARYSFTNRIVSPQTMDSTSINNLIEDISKRADEDNFRNVEVEIDFNDRRSFRQMFEYQLDKSVEWAKNRANRMVDGGDSGNSFGIAFPIKGHHTRSQAMALDTIEYIADRMPVGHIKNLDIAEDINPVVNLMLNGTTPLDMRSQASDILSSFGSDKVSNILESSINDSTDNFGLQMVANYIDHYEGGKLGLEASNRKGAALYDLYDKLSQLVEAGDLQGSLLTEGWNGGRATAINSMDNIRYRLGRSTNPESINISNMQDLLNDKANLEHSLQQVRSAINVDPHGSMEALIWLGRKDDEVGQIATQVLVSEARSGNSRMKDWFNHKSPRVKEARLRKKSDLTLQIADIERMGIDTEATDVHLQSLRSQLEHVDRKLAGYPATDTVVDSMTVDYQQVDQPALMSPKPSRGYEVGTDTISDQELISMTEGHLAEDMAEGPVLTASGGYGPPVQPQPYQLGMEDLLNHDAEYYYEKMPTEYNELKYQGSQVDDPDEDFFDRLGREIDEALDEGAIDQDAAEVRRADLLLAQLESEMTGEVPIRVAATSDPHDLHLFEASTEAVDMAEGDLTEARAVHEERGDVEIIPEPLEALVAEQVGSPEWFENNAEALSTTGVDVSGSEAYRLLQRQTDRHRRGEIDLNEFVNEIESNSSQEARESVAGLSDIDSADDVPNAVGQASEPQMWDELEELAEEDIRQDSLGRPDPVGFVVGRRAENERLANMEGVSDSERLRRARAEITFALRANDRPREWAIALLPEEFEETWGGHDTWYTEVGETTADPVGENRIVPIGLSGEEQSRRMADDYIEPDALFEERFTTEDQINDVAREEFERLGYVTEDTWIDQHGTVEERRGRRNAEQFRAENPDLERTEEEIAEYNERQDRRQDSSGRPDPEGFVVGRREENERAANVPWITERIRNRRARIEYAYAERAGDQPSDWAREALEPLQEVAEGGHEQLVAMSNVGVVRPENNRLGSEGGDLETQTRRAQIELQFARQQGDQPAEWTHDLMTEEELAEFGIQESRIDREGDWGIEVDTLGIDEADESLEQAAHNHSVRTAYQRDTAGEAATIDQGAATEVDLNLQQSSGPTPTPDPIEGIDVPLRATEPADVGQVPPSQPPPPGGGEPPIGEPPPIYPPGGRGQPPSGGSTDRVSRNGRDFVYIDGELWAQPEFKGHTPYNFKRNGERLYFDPVTRRYVERMYDAFNDRTAVQKMLRLYDEVHGIFKATTLFPFAPYHLKNVFDGMFWRNQLAGLHNGDAYAYAGKLMQMHSSKNIDQARELKKELGDWYGYKPEELIKIGMKGKAISSRFALEQVLQSGPDTMNRHSIIHRMADSVGLGLNKISSGVMGRWAKTFTDKRNEISTALASTTKGGVKKEAKRVGRYLNSPLRYGFEVNDFSESMMRMSLVLDRLSKGDAPLSATNMAKAVHFDYDDLSPLERNVFKRLISFYTFASKNIPLHLKLKFGGAHRKFKPYSTLVKQRSDTDDPKVKRYMAEYLKHDVPLRVWDHGDGEYSYFMLGRWISDVQLDDVIKPSVGETIKQWDNMVGWSLSGVLRPIGESLKNRKMHKLSDLLPGNEPRPRDRIAKYDGQTTSYLGMRVRARVAHGLDQIRAFRELNRMNPGGIFGKAADTMPPKTDYGQPSIFGQNAMGRRDEDALSRAMYFFIGKSLYRMDVDRMKMSKMSRNKARAIMPAAVADHWYETNDLIDPIDVPASMVKADDLSKLRYQLQKKAQAVDSRKYPKLYHELDFAANFSFK